MAPKPKRVSTNKAGPAEPRVNVKEKAPTMEEFDWSRVVPINKAGEETSTPGWNPVSTQQGLFVSPLGYKRKDGSLLVPPVIRIESMITMGPDHTEQFNKSDKDIGVNFSITPAPMTKFVNEGDARILGPDFKGKLVKGEFKYEAMRKKGKINKDKHPIEAQQEKDKEKVVEDPAKPFARYDDTFTASIPINTNSTTREKKATIPLANSAGQPVLLEQLEWGVYSAAWIEIPYIYKQNGKGTWGVKRRIAKLNTMPSKRVVKQYEDDEPAPAPMNPPEDLPGAPPGNPPEDPPMPPLDPSSTSTKVDEEVVSTKRVESTVPSA